MNAKLGLLITKFTQMLLLLLIISRVECFNVDVVNYIRHELNNGSMFGFSVALHQEQQRSWVIVGAPNADTSQFQYGVQNGGGVYRCDISDDNRCQIIHFDSKGNNYNENNEQIDTKSKQWFGATVASAGIDGPLVACAPRYVYHQHQPRKVERIEPVGTCWIAKNNFENFAEFSPCRTMYWGYHRQGSCQAGMSAAVNKDGDRLFIGAPGSWYWQGQVYSINTDAVLPYKPPRYGQFGEGQVYTYSLSNPKDRVYSTKESNSKEDDSYLGYSSVSGDFNGDGVQDVAVGMPRGAGLLGKVLIFSWNLTNIQNITGEQIGAYFGYSIIAVDVDGDKLDDIIVGAPMYTEKNNEGKYEHGRVYIIYQNRTNKFKEVETREGVNSKGRFGLSLAALGDINLDGYGDFAVGAPYDGPNGRGAVYIYHGSINGPLEKASQVIFAEDVVGTPNLRTFGFSIAGGIDLDGNQYPDMVVGAYESSRAIVFKSRPVAVMEASTVFSSENKLISLENKTCTLSSGKKVTCTKITSCLRYNGINLKPSIDIDISWILDSKKVNTPRMFFLHDETKNIINSTMRLYRGKSDCRTDQVYIAEGSDGVRDKLTALEVEMKYNIREATTRYSSSAVTRVKRSELEPILDQNIGTVRRDSINIMKNCGKDNICIPDLQLKVNTNEKYILGGNESLVVEVLVTNHGEDAFEAGFYMNLPKGLNYKSTRKISEGTPYSCNSVKASPENVLKCDIGNPLGAGKAINFKIIFEPSEKAGITPFYEFHMEANSTNEEAEGSNIDNVFKKTVPISIESEFSIVGKSDPSDFHYNVTQYLPIKNATNEGEIGPQIVHIYDIRNTGTSSIDEIELFINWPHETLDGDPLMYLLNEPEVHSSGAANVVCDPVQYVNSRNLKLDRSLERKSYLTGGLPRRSGIQGRWTGKQDRKYNSQGGSSHEASFDENQESFGDASEVHRNRGSYHESWRTSSSSGTSGSSGITTDRHGNTGSVGNFDWSNKQTGGQYESSGSHRGQGNRGQSGSSGSSYYEGTVTGERHASHGQGQGSRQSGSSSTGYYESSSEGSTQSRFNNRYSSASGTNGQAGDARVTEYEYHEQWNSTSVNGGPAVTTITRKNQTYVRGQDGSRVRLSETSTESTIIAGGFGHSVYGNQNVNSQDNRYTEESGDADYERRRQEYYENVRRRQEQERRHQEELRRRQQEEQRRIEEERIRVEEEKRQLEEERRRYQSTRTSSSTSQGSQGGYRQNTNYESSYTSQSGVRGGSSFNSGSSQGARTSSSSSSGISGGGRSETHYDENVHQDISSLAARTHAEQQESSSGSHHGRRRMMSQQDGEPLRPGLVTGVTQLEKVAQGGQGFQTLGLDVSVPIRNNVDDDLRHQSESSRGSQYSSSSSSGYNTHHSSGGRTGSSGSHYSSNQGYNEDDYEDEEEISYDEYDHADDDSHNARQGNAYSSHTSYSQSYSSSSNPQFKHYRKTREAVNLGGGNSLCQSANCVSARCVISNLNKNSEALVALRMRLAAHTLHKLGGDMEVRLSTMAVGKITKLPYVGTPANETFKSHEIYVTAIPDPIPKPDIIPLWIFILAACAGALILLLLILLLYKCGFFKRNRPQGSPHERQPLNRNGNGFHGDEHL